MLGARMAIIVVVTTSARLVPLDFGASVDRTRANPAFLVPIRWKLHHSAHVALQDTTLARLLLNVLCVRLVSILMLGSHRVFCVRQVHTVLLVLAVALRVRMAIFQEQAHQAVTPVAIDNYSLHTTPATPILQLQPVCGETTLLRRC